MRLLAGIPSEFPAWAKRLVIECWFRFGEDEDWSKWSSDARIVCSSDQVWSPVQRRHSITASCRMCWTERCECELLQVVILHWALISDGSSCFWAVCTSDDGQRQNGSGVWGYGESQRSQRYRIGDTIRVTWGRSRAWRWILSVRILLVFEETQRRFFNVYTRRRL